MSGSVFSVGALYLILVLVGQLYFKKSAQSVVGDSFSSIVKSALLNYQLWIALITYTIAMVSWIWLLRHIDLSRIFPIMSALLLLTVPLMSAYFLQETLTLRYWGGVLLIMVGIALIASEIRVS